MANPTTNYSFAMPTNTDLVKDLPADFEVFGQAVDTKLKALNPSTTLGDIEYRSATTDTNTRLGIGSSGQVLTVSGGVPTWATSSSGGMTLISTTTLTGASVTLSSIPQTYNKLFLVIRNYLPADDSSNLYMRFNGDTNANRHRDLSQYTTFYYNTSFAFDSTSCTISPPNDNAVGSGQINITVFDYTNTTTWKMAEYISLVTSDSNTAQYKHLAGSIFYNQTAAVTSLTFFPTSGNFTSGSILLYGVK